MARLEQHILQIKKREPDLLKTVRNGFGQIQRRAEGKRDSVPDYSAGTGDLSA